MDPKKLGRYTAYLVIVIAVFLYVFGGTNFTTVFNTNGTKGTLESGITHNAVGSLNSRLGGSLVRQQMIRKDLIIFVSYSYILEFTIPGNIPGSEKIDYSVKLPGRITSSNSDRNDALYWEKLPEDNRIYAYTRETRWWLIALVAILGALNLINYLMKRKREGQNENI